MTTLSRTGWNQLKDIVCGVDKRAEIREPQVHLRNAQEFVMKVSAADLESLEETLDIMENTVLLADIKGAVIEIGAGAAVPLSKDEALRLINGS